jgi:hypothetical protein
VIVIDSREQEPLKFENFPSVPGTLYAGDYSIRGLEASFAVERKSIDDLANCCLAAQRNWFEHELHRLRGYRFKRLLIVGPREDIAAGHYYSRIPYWRHSAAPGCSAQAPGPVESGSAETTASSLTSGNIIDER